MLATSDLSATNKHVVVWDPRDGREISRIPIECPTIRLAFSPDGNTLAIGGDDKIVRLCDASDFREFAQLPHDSHVTQLRFAPDGSYLATQTSKTTGLFTSTPTTWLWNTQS